MLAVEGADLNYKFEGSAEAVEAISSHMNNAKFRLSLAEGGFFVPVSSENESLARDFSLSELPVGQYSLDAIRDLQNQVVRELTKTGYYGIVVIASPDQIDPRTGEDLREGGRALTFDVWFNKVTDIRTVGRGVRVTGQEPLNNSQHVKILNNSPVTLTPESSESSEAVYIQKNELDNYLDRLNRQPRRRVDVALSSAGEPGSVVLDYIVSESKPWLAYAQVSNTGTESTGEWRQRIGGVHNQITGHDDSLTLDFLTASLDRANALYGSYEIPLIFPDYLVARAYGSYSDFAAENLQIIGAPDSEGETVTYGAELAYTPFYVWKHAISAVVGIKYEDMQVENLLGGGVGEANFLTPYIRLEASKNKLTHTSRFSASYESNLDHSNDSVPLTLMGRLNTTDEFDTLNFDFFQSFYLEPLFPSYHQPNPDSWLSNSLVQELAFSVRGQLVMDDARVVPQKQYFGGGFFSVRGYEESAARGDSGIIGSAEYRIHIARLFKPAALLDATDVGEGDAAASAEGRFNFRAPNLYGFPDWDLMLRGFVDYASFTFSDPDTTEIDQDLLSAGVGIEFQYKSNLSIRVDYGVVLKELEDFSGQPIDNAEKGDSRFHVMATYSF